MLELPNFGRMTTFKIQFESRDTFFDDSIDLYYEIITFISEYSYIKAWHLTELASLKLQSRWSKEPSKSQ